MIADEAKSQLQIYGTFGPDHTGFATIENTKQTVRSWSDTMVICDLPDSGAGSGGHVTVTKMSGTSNTRMLSIFQVRIQYPLFVSAGIDGKDAAQFGLLDWHLSWRGDILSRNSPVDSVYLFEISRISYGIAEDGYHGRNYIKYWSDSLPIKKGSVSMKGTINLNENKILFGYAYFILADSEKIGPYYNQQTIYYLPYPTTFDFFGNINAYRDIGTDGNAYNTYRWHRDVTLSGTILFPPETKNLVQQSPQPTSNLVKIFTHFGSEDHHISLEAEVSLGEITASLYRIDGRLLKQEKITIPSPGMYSFDASGISVNFGFLVIKTSKGIVAGKVMF